MWYGSSMAVIFSTIFFLAVMPMPGELRFGRQALLSPFAFKRSLFSDRAQRVGACAARYRR